VAELGGVAGIGPNHVKNEVDVVEVDGEKQPEAGVEFRRGLVELGNATGVVRLVVPRAAVEGEAVDAGEEDKTGRTRQRDEREHREKLRRC
jgi:hypothetical protein